MLLLQLSGGMKMLPALVEVGRRREPVGRRDEHVVEQMHLREPFIVGLVEVELVPFGVGVLLSPHQERGPDDVDGEVVALVVYDLVQIVRIPHGVLGPRYLQASPRMRHPTRKRTTEMQRELVV
jgi:hypothetical protein